MNRVVWAVFTIVFILTIAILATTPARVDATWPEMRQVSDPARDSGLNLGFAEVSGAFLGEVAVVIEDRAGNELVNTVVDGPWLFVPLPAGSYNVKAIFDDQMKQVKDVRLSDQQVTMMVVYWDLNVPATQMMASSQDGAKS
jgi:hypothetical protein